jgi:methyl-accepting chemotaxis protein
MGILTSLAFGVYFFSANSLEQKVTQLDRALTALQQAAMGNQEITIGVNQALANPKGGDPRKISKSVERVSSAIERATQNIGNEEIKKKLADFSKLIAGPVSVAISEFSATVQSNPAKAFDFYKNRYSKIAAQIEDDTDTIGGMISEDLAHLQKSRKDQMRRFGIVLGFLQLLTVLVQFGYAHYLARTLSHSLQQIGESLSTCSTDVHGASSEILGVAENVASFTRAQAEAISTTVNSSDQINRMFAQTADSLLSSTAAAQVCLSLAEQGAELADKLTASIAELQKSNHEISNNTETNNLRIQEIVKFIAEIGSKTQVINDIVFQTKLLSFNASVEAARAGEHGKGFAVVAEEVGKLAQMSGAAAKEIREMLDVSMQKSEVIVKESRSRISGVLEAANGCMNLGADNAAQCSEALQSIAAKIRDLVKMIEVVSSATQGQSLDMEKVAVAIQKINEMTQSNSEASQHAASAARQLATQATQLQEATETLDHAIQGKEATLEPKAASAVSLSTS